ncbi:hypothetical protein Hypma_001335 [Hypsizygus marmoreus]|uniref:Uncharacterized protein n=1 Tax=Hypsizygus marmoreus TaxID=39966 RepID=A0A369K667_HYPMA|nr:hypothetical protein Hypma_001335 [Hypsizygus marmoreus]
MQKTLTPKICDCVAAQTLAHADSEDPEKEILFLPSDFSESERADLDLSVCAQHEHQLREGEAFDALRHLQTIVKTLDALSTAKRKDARGQDQNTRALTRIKEVEGQRDLAMRDYAAARTALLALGEPEADNRFPTLTLQDTYRKSTRDKREVGDSRRMDGKLWVNTGVTGGAQPVVPQLTDDDEAPVSTQVSQRKKRKDTKTRKNAKGTKRQGPSLVVEEQPPTECQGTESSRSANGWIWHLGVIGKLSDEELEDWLDEGDRVQWFRAEAEVERWQEQWETKQAEFLRCIRSFGKMQFVWTELADSQTTIGHIAYARQKAAMYARMARDAQAKFNTAGYSHCMLKDGEILADQIQIDRHNLNATALGQSMVPQHQPSSE